jgi:hypothetical protein
MKHKNTKLASVIVVTVVSLFLSATQASAATFNSWSDLRDSINTAGGTGEFLIEPGAVIEAENQYLYDGTFTGSLNGGTGDGLANINGLTKPLFNILGAGSVISGLQLSASSEDSEGVDHTGDGNIGVTGQGILANQTNGAIVENVRAIGSITADGNDIPWLRIYRFNDNLGGLIGSAQNNTQIIDSSFAGAISGISDTPILTPVSSNYVGGLVGYLENSTLENSTAKVVNLIGGDFVGGLVGKSSYSTIDSAIVAGKIIANNGVGGLVGGATASTVKDSLSKTVVLATGDSVGGLVGVLVNDVGRNSEISSSVFIGLVNSNAPSDDAPKPNSTGGLVGLNYGNVVDSSVITSGSGINGTFQVGGLVGANYGQIQNSFFSGTVSGMTTVGGIVGFNATGGSIINSVAIGNVFCEAVPGVEIPCTSEIGSLTGLDDSTGSINSISTASLIPSGEPVPIDSETVTNYLDYLNFGYLTKKWKADICYNSGKPFLNSNTRYFSNDCAEPTIVREFIPFIPSLIGEYAQEIAEIKGFEQSLILPTDAPLQFLNKLDQADLEKIFTSSFDINTIREITLDNLLPIQLEIKGEVGESSQVWVQTPEGDWINLGVITFDEQGNAILPALKFADLGNYKIAFFSNTTGEKELIDPSKSGAIGSINLQVK